MRVLGYILVTIGILFGVYLLLIIVGLSVAPADLKGEKQSYIIGYRFGTVVAVIVLAALDILLIRFGKKLIRKAKNQTKAETINEIGK